jgi:selenide,water dikinase
VAEAGGVLAGGHTLDDKEPKYGLSVMGLIHPDRILTKGGARPGDALVLTKPLGVGIITTAFKGDVADLGHLTAAADSMKQLNRTASRLAQKVDVRGCTDITGFALLGHSFEMADKSGVRLRFFVDHLSFLDGAVEYADQWLFPAGTCNNERGYEHGVHFAAGVSEEMRQLLYTPETSGGLLVAVPSERLETLLAFFAEDGHPCWVVGEVIEGQGIEVVS